MTDTPWITWEGGECPVEPDVEVVVTFRSLTFGVKRRVAGKMDWGRFGGAHLGTDIIAYRIIQP
jgi:hypothetical protein